MDGDFYIGENKREKRKEGKKVIEEAISYIKDLKDLWPMYWNKYIAKAAIK